MRPIRLNGRFRESGAWDGRGMPVEKIAEAFAVGSFAFRTGHRIEHKRFQAFERVSIARATFLPLRDQALPWLFSMRPAGRGLVAS
jgi:hypothetical protein